MEYSFSVPGGTVEHWKSTNGILLNVESLMQAAFPAAAKDDALRYTQAYDYIWRVMAARRRVTLKRADAKTKKR